MKHVITTLDKEILELLAHGYRPKEIGEKVFRALDTISGRIYKMKIDFEAKTNIELVVMAIMEGLIFNDGKSLEKREQQYLISDVQEQVNKLFIEYKNNL